MCRYIIQAPTRSNLPFLPSHGLIERNDPLVQLLSNRRTARIICAPSLYGKSTLAYQYSQIAFTPQKIAWVTCADPLFICDLDNNSLTSRFDALSAQSLVVFDGVALYLAERNSTFTQTVQHLLDNNHEVMITTRDTSLTRMTLPNPTLPAPIVVTARNLGVIPASVTAHTQQSPVDVRLFGRFELTRNGQHLPEQGDVRKKAKLLIALLVANHDKELTRLGIEQALWPQADSQHARGSFYNLWSYTQSLLADPKVKRVRLKRSRDTISLNDLPITSDVYDLETLLDEFKDCTDATQCKIILTGIERLYVGPLLPGETNAELVSCRMRYQNRVLDTLLEGIEILNKQSELICAKHFAEFAFHIEPTREDVCYQYMQTQKTLGQFAGAISTFLGCRRALIDRFGIEASSRLDTLYQEILHETSQEQKVVENAPVCL